ncbi:MAG TPA: choice-of-anchor D domain-containing protein [Acidimicrobiales bacterium]|nr:choice-of-anchor D domain-containing protein [Acidimicrobiales bacterium]
MTATGPHWWRRRGVPLTLLAALLAGVIACAGPSGDPEASPSALDFGATTVGATATRDVVVTNVAASGPWTIESVGIAGTDAAVFDDDFDDASAPAVDPGGSFTLRVSFAPTVAGQRSATLHVNHSGAGALSIPLSGTGVEQDPGATPLVAAPASVGLPAIPVGQAASQDVVLRNGAASGAIVVQSTAVSGGDAAMFSDGFDETPRTLAPGQSVTVAVTFRPTAPGPRSATLSVTHTGSNTPLRVPLSGDASPAPSSTVLYRVNSGGPAVAGAAGTPAWSEDSTARPSPFVNTAASGNQVASHATPADMSHPSVPAGTPVGLFRNDRWDPAAAPDMAYSFPVPSGVAVEVRLYLAEMIEPLQVVGGRVFDVNVEATTAFRDVDVFARVGANRALMLAAPAVSDGAIDVRFVAGVQNPSVSAIEVVTTASAVPPVLAVSPSTVAFPDARVRQTTTQDVTLTNVGTTGPLTVSSTAISGPDGALFADRFDDSSPVVLGPGESTTLELAFLPTATGARSALLAVTHTGTGSPLEILLSGTASAAGGGMDPPFGRSVLAGAGVNAPTSLQFGPDGRLYVAQMDGTIKVLTIARGGAHQYAVTATETITLVRSMPNRNDNGALNPAVTGRLVTGLLVTGTPGNPQIYVVSSDPRIGAGTSGADLDLDTNSGILSRLTRTTGGWTKADLVRGLPRSEENHTGNGLTIDPSSGRLLIAYGGHTNKGAPSHNFAELPEYALSAAVLSVDLGALGGAPFDLPTLDDEDRPGTADANDPFGGNDGHNQARLVPGGPVQIHAAGFRNPYDLVASESGDLYTIDNGGNAGWGGAPQPDGPAGTCTNALVETSDTDADALIRIPGPGFYGGHPNPTRANPANTFNASNPQSPVAAAHPVECDYRTEVERGALASFAFSTNGLDEYTADNFDHEMEGDLLAASHDDAIYRIQLSADGTQVTSRSVLFSSAASVPLDVTALGASDPFPGTIWVAGFLGDEVVVFEPEDFACTGADNGGLDEDGDGYDNADEIDNGTNPCSPADHPPDADADMTSDLNDPDDDNDGLPDISDPFAIDAANGRDTPLPSVLTWDNDAPPAGGLMGLGFTGLMANGSSGYASLFDAAKMTAGGAAGVVTVDEVADGDALGPANTQQYAFQHGVDVSATTGPFVVHTRLPAPFSGVAATGGQSFGVFMGTGSQDDYVSLAVAANAGAGGFRLVNEQGGVPSTLTAAGPAWPGPAVVDLYLRVDPAAATVQASYAVDGAPPVPVSGPQSVPASWFSGATAPAVGIISTSTGPAPVFPASWDFLEVQPAGGGGTPPSAMIAVGAPGLNSSTFNSGSFRVTNDSPGGQQIASVRLDLSTSVLPDLVFDPVGVAGDSLGKGFTVDANPGVGTIGHAFGGSHDGGFDALTATFTDFGPGETLTFSADVDPTSIRGSGPPGPGESGSVSGLELTGATVTVTYEDGTFEASRLFRTPGSLGESRARLDGVGRAVPSIAVVGVPANPATITEPAQTVRVTGPAGAAVRLLAVEGALFTAGLPGGGFDIDAFEVNSVVAVNEHAVTIGAGGSVDVPVTFGTSSPTGGNHRLVAVVESAGAAGPTSGVRVVQFDPP